MITVQVNSKKGMVTFIIQLVTINAQCLDILHRLLSGYSIGLFVKIESEILLCYFGYSVKNGNVDFNYNLNLSIIYLLNIKF